MKKLLGFILVLVMALCLGGCGLSGFQNVKVGEIVKFGNYGGQEIEWQVLEVKDGQALFLSKYGLDAKAYDTTDTKVTWETCTLRYWLNNDFYNKAFNTEEQQKIVLSRVTVLRSVQYKFQKYNTYQGKDTQDKVFLLSLPEVEKYFPNAEARKCLATNFAKQHGADVSKYDGGSTWWLRSVTHWTGDSVGSTGNLYHGDDDNDVDSSVIRPAIRVDLNKM